MHPKIWLYKLEELHKAEYRMDFMAGTTNLASYQWLVSRDICNSYTSWSKLLSVAIKSIAYTNNWLKYKEQHTMSYAKQFLHQKLK